MEQKSAILELFEQVEMNKDTSQEYRELAKKYSIKRTEFENSLDNKQKQELDELMLLKGDTDFQEVKEYFIEGFCIATRLTTEAFYKEHKQ